MHIIRKLLSSPIAILAGLLGLCVLTYGGLSPTMGLYWDDWPSLWFLHFFGPGIFPEAFSIDRPVQGYLFLLTTKVFGESLFAWQVFGMLARWISGIAFGSVLISLWPNKPQQALGAVILFLVYPGFSQQSIAITYGHQQLVFSMMLFSLFLMIWSIRKPAHKFILTAASLLSGLLSMLALEYFFGLELLRPVFIWLVLAESSALSGSRFVETGKRWLPYFIMDIGFLIWRLTHSTPRGEVTIFENLKEAPGDTLANLLRTIFGDFYASAVTAWVRAINTLNFSGVKRSVLVAYLLTALSVGILSFILLMLIKYRANRAKEIPLRDRWGITASLVGVYALIIGGWSFWVTDLRLDLSVPWDRFTQPLMPGVCLLVIGLIDLLFRPWLLKFLIISLLAGVSAGNQFRNALDYRQEWIDQRTFFWQLAWRAPEIEPGTLLLTSQLAFHVSTDNSLSAAINWIYAPELDSREMPYFLYDIEARLNNRLPGLEPNLPIQQDYRAAEFIGTTNQTLVYYFNPPRCLKMLDLYTDRHYPNKPGLVVLGMPLSDLSLIKAGKPGSPNLPVFFNPEPIHSWCYFFEKVDLYVQLEQFEKAVKYADEALKLKPELTENNAPELIPFIYAYAQTGKYDKAKELSLQAGKLSNKMHYYMCDTWYYLSQKVHSNPEFDTALSEINQKFECTPP